MLKNTGQKTNFKKTDKRQQRN